MPRIIISYRRQDSQDIAMRVRDRLAARYGEKSVFTDIDNIPLGTDFVQHINAEIARCSALIAVVGPRWLDAGRPDGQGITLETDFVRMEVEAALKRGLPVVPILVGGARMPRESELPASIRKFVYRNATAVDSGSNFRNDVDRVIRSLDQTFSAAGTGRWLPAGRRARLALACAVVLVASAGVIAAVTLGPVGVEQMVRGALGGSEDRSAPSAGPAGAPQASPAAAAATPAVPPAPPKVQQTPSGVPDELKALIERKEFGRAAELARPLAEAGSAEAQYILGRIYELGGPFPADPQQAAVWYGKAAAQGFARAQYYLGLLYENGRGVPQDVAQAVSLYAKAAAQGDPAAQNDLGVIYALGQGVPRDDDKALRNYQLSADQGYAKAQKNLGDMYLQGRGVARDPQQAFSWYRKAADQGFADAQFLVGYMYERGLGTNQDSAQALGWYGKAAAQGNAAAQRALDRLHASSGDAAKPDTGSTVLSIDGLLGSVLSGKYYRRRSTPP